MAPFQEELEMTPRDSAVLEVTSSRASECQPDRDDTFVTNLDDEDPETNDPEVDEPDGNLVTKAGPVNEFRVRRSTVQNMLDLALVAANISQLRIILTVGPGNLDFYYLMLSCVCLSLGFQVLFAIIILIVKIREDKMKSVSRDPEVQTESRRPTRDKVTDRLNCLSMALVLFVLLLNMVLSGFITVRKNSPADKIGESFTVGLY
ncbi:ninjurin-1-like [Haliotis rubra]|uniref:ninjurin-1-like n=1 Tax=Haliotis rubra TaxID=36100 RepID=UPI001EE59682|nr:ninjurin-1-like [Haliotis rubra]